LSRFHRGNREDGASLIEFALVMPLLVLLIFGMVDAGWAFFQNLEVRHGAREAARLAAVDFDKSGDVGVLIEEVCHRMNTSSSDVTVRLSTLDGTAPPNAKAVARVEQAYTSITGFLPFFKGITLSSQVEIRIEREATWAADTGDPSWQSGTTFQNDCKTPLS